jgi:Putative restriction endonuclease
VVIAIAVWLTKDKANGNPRARLQSQSPAEYWVLAIASMNAARVPQGLNRIKKARYLRYFKAMLLNSKQHPSLSNSNAMTVTAAQPTTLEEFLQLPGTKPASEYIEGAIVQKPMPKGRHSRLQSKLGAAVNHVAEEPKIAYAFPRLYWK